MDGSMQRKVRLDRPSSRDCEPFLERARASRSVHRPWVYPPSTAVEFARFLEGANTERHEAFLVRPQRTGEIAGVVVLSEIVRGVLQSAYVGFYAMVPYERAGYMQAGLRLLLKHAFRELRLHRLEAGIQPANRKSINLVRRCGFRNEGYSPRYLKIGGRWRDHERWAILADEWQAARTGTLRPYP
jgi:ribosomal-protein-alanine N-acetyltransferase